MSELVADNEAAIEARKSGKPRGPITGLPTLDKTLGGYLANGVHIFQAGPGAGKTALALQIAATCGFPALFITAEMPPLELFKRIIARATKTFLGELKSGEIGTKDLERKAQEAAAKSPWLSILDATCSYVEPNHFIGIAESLRERANASRLLLIVDSLQYWAKSAGSASEYELISNGMHALSEVAGQLACPIIAISQRNRAGNKSDGGLYASKGSGDVEYAGESVIDLTRKDDNPDPSGKIEVNLSIYKNRHGEVGRHIALEFSGRLQMFTEQLQ